MHFRAIYTAEVALFDKYSADFDVIEDILEKKLTIIEANMKVLM